MYVGPSRLAFPDRAFRVSGLDSHKVGDERAGGVDGRGLRDLTKAVVLNESPITVMLLRSCFFRAAV